MQFRIKQESILKTIFKNLSKAFLLIIFLSVLVLSAALIIFQIYKDDITKSLLLTLNQEQSGEIIISNVSLAPFEHFPNISLKIDTLTLFELKKNARIDDEIPILNLNEVYIAINALDILNSHFNVSAISVNSGSAFLKTYADSSFNLSNIFLELPKEEILIDAPEFETEKNDKNENALKNINKAKAGIDLSIDKLSLENLKVVLINDVTKNRVYFEIVELISSFNLKKESTNLLIQTRLNIDSLISNSHVLLNDISGSIDTKVNLSHLTSLIEFSNSSILIGDAGFIFKGTYNPENEGEIDLSIQADDKSTGIFSLILAQEGIDNLKKGELQFSATVKGKTFEQLPNINANFNLKNVELLNPVTNRTIKNLMFAGNFNSGFQNNFSDASLFVDTLNAEIHKGHVAFRGSISNFTAPKLDINMDINADITGLEDVLNIEFIEDLKGRIQIKDEFKGEYVPDQNRFISEKNKSKIEFENFGINIPGIIKLENVNGTICREEDIYRIEDLKLISDNTDLLFNGDISNINYLFFGVEKDIEANINISADIFDLPNFLAFDPSIKRDFPYRIVGLDLSVALLTTTNKVLNFNSFPEFNADIKKLNATIENFLPEININSGKFKLSEDLLGFNMKFQKFKTMFLNGNFDFTGEYNSSKQEPFYIKLNTSFLNIYPSHLFVDTDSIPDFLNGELSGSLFIDLQLPVDSTILKFANIKNADLTYKFSEDTIETKSLNLSFLSVNFNETLNPNPLATLTTRGSLRLSELRSNNFSINDAKLNFDVNEGEYKIGSNQLRLFGKSARGNSNVTVKPFADIPSIKINYDVQRFYAEEMLETFLEDTVISGPLSLSMELNSEGFEWETLVKNLNGNINLTGNEIIFYGIDADEVIDKFKRSQSFNLVDLGAVMLAGPVGIAVTKGTDFANIFLFNDGVSSKINKLVYDWEIKNGDFNIKEAAFATDKNRIATKGNINFANDSLNITIALLNIKGCSIFSQLVNGKLDEPSVGNVKVVGTLLAPVTNLIDDVFGSDCDVFYEGKVKHPMTK